MAKYVISQAERAISCAYILACWMQYAGYIRNMPDIYGNMPDIYRCMKAICRSREYMCEIIATSSSDAYSASQQFAQFGMLFQYCISAICRSAENVLCSEIIGTHSQQLLLPKCLSNSAVYSYCSVDICAPQNNSFSTQQEKKKIV